MKTTQYIRIERAISAAATSDIRERWFWGLRLLRDPDALAGQSSTPAKPGTPVTKPKPQRPGMPRPTRGAGTVAPQSPTRQDHAAAAVDLMSTPGGPVSSRHGGRKEPVVAAADSEGRAGLTPPGAVPSMPKPLGPPRFGGTNPPPPPPQPFPPNPFPPPSTAVT